MENDIKPWQWVVTVIVIVILIVLGHAMFSTGTEVRPEVITETVKERCERLGMYKSMADLPVSCLKYFSESIKINTLN